MLGRLVIFILLASWPVGCTSELQEQPCTTASGTILKPGESSFNSSTCEICQCGAEGASICERVPDCRNQAIPIWDMGADDGKTFYDNMERYDAGPNPEYPEEPNDQCTYGNLSGTACGPDGQDIAGAVITVRGVDCQGMAVVQETRANANGQYALGNLPEGTVTITLEIGSFSRDFSVDIRGGETTDLDTTGADYCLSRDAAKIAVITGSFDHIEGILDDMGFEYDLFCGDAPSNAGARTLFGDWDRLTQYDVVFINCGSVLPLTHTSGRSIVENLQRFVSEGGSVYISDLAASVITQAWPNSVRFRGISESLPGGFDFGLPPEQQACCACTTNCPPSCGINPMGVTHNDRGDMCLGSMFDGRIPFGFFCPGDIMMGDGYPGQVQARLESEILRTALGRDSLAVHFDTGGWVEIDSVGPNTEVLVSGPYAPLMSMYTDPSSGGRVAYTTFHNETQTSSDVQAILRALIFQL